MAIAGADGVEDVLRAGLLAGCAGGDIHTCRQAGNSAAAVVTDEDLSFSVFPPVSDQ